MNTLEYLNYVQDPTAQGWLQRGAAEKQGVLVSFAYMDIVDGNPYDAMMLAQILYWHDIDEKTRRPRITHWRDGHLWIVKTFGEWREELHFKSERTIKECAGRLFNQQIIVKERHKSPFHNEQVVSFIRMNWPVFGERVKTVLGETLNVHPEETLNVYPGGTLDVHSGKTSDVRPIYTETTTETTAKTTTEKTASPSGETANPNGITTTSGDKLTFMELAVIKAFKLPYGKSNFSWGYMRQLTNFFTGKIKTPGKKSRELYDFQFDERPLEPKELLGLALWYGDNFEDVAEFRKLKAETHWRKWEQFSQDGEYRRYVRQGKEQLKLYVALLTALTAAPAELEPDPPVGEGLYTLEELQAQDPDFQPADLDALANDMTVRFYE